jgi:hypothetical protein
MLTLCDLKSLIFNFGYILKSKVKSWEYPCSDLPHPYSRKVNIILSLNGIWNNTKKDCCGLNRIVNKFTRTNWM